MLYDNEKRIRKLSVFISHMSFILYIFALYHINVHDMKKKFKELLSEKCKDMGLTEKALTDLTSVGMEGLSDDVSEEDIEKGVDLLVPFAKAMQAEITRKTQKAQSEQQSKTEGNEGGNGNDIPDWFKSEMEARDKQLSELKKENENLKTENQNKTRGEIITKKAKELGIPEFLMKRFSLSEDADIEKELTEYKQDLVTNKLMSEDGTHNRSTSEEAIKEDAKRFAEGI